MNTDRSTDHNERVEAFVVSPHIAVCLVAFMSFIRVYPLKSVVACLLSIPLADVGEVAGDGGCGGHLRADEVGAATAALTAFEVAVRGGGAALTGLQDVGVHAEAHGAAGLAPLEAGRLEYLVQA